MTQSYLHMHSTVINPHFVKKFNSKECWLIAELDFDYCDGHTLKKLPLAYERDISNKDKYIIRKKKRFYWERKKESENLKNLISYHKKVRKDLYYILGSTKLWYIKRNNNVEGWIGRSSLSLTFAAMHRLSELSRYNPVTLSRHLNSQHNFLLSEFIRKAPYQFIDEISSEITGEEFMTPGISLR